MSRGCWRVRDAEKCRGKTSQLFILTSFLNRPSYQRRQYFASQDVDGGSTKRNWQAAQDTKVDVLAHVLAEVKVRKPCGPLRPWAHFKLSLPAEGGPGHSGPILLGDLKLPKRPLRWQAWEVMEYSLSLTLFIL